MEEKIKKQIKNLLEINHSKQIEKEAQKIKVQCWLDEVDIQYFGDVLCIIGRYNGYTIHIMLGAVQTSSCSCKGWFFKKRCKHIYNSVQQYAAYSLQNGYPSFTKKNN